ncbi:hypothetical protein QM012_005734 [Aureobasidium pullulans]|uniref:Ubiquitin 3 binding protein But2 C-terminal domain-containing protein n=1 Tax=Aureobasidium pullulans TaxID=5580 RepID=A0ABR0TS70_AURPU
MNFNAKSMILAALSALLFSTEVTAYAQIKLYSDGQCQNAIEGATWGSDIGLDNQLNYLEITNGVRDVQDLSNPVSDPVFPGTNTTGGGSVVYFDVPEPDNTCAYVIMTDYIADKQYGDNPLPGMALIWASRAGCYYAEVPTGNSLFTTYCCGSGDCSSIDLGQTSILPSKRDLSKTTASNDKRTVSSLTGLAAAAKLRARDDSCKLYNADGSDFVASNSNKYTKAGRQQAISGIEVCSNAPCSISETGTIDTTTTLTSSSSTSITFEAGFSVGITAGTNFIVEAEVSAEVSASITKSWETATGRDVSNGTSQSVTHELSIVQGQNAFLTFIPTYTCYQAYMACDGQPMSSEPLEYCTVPNDASIKSNGVFSAVYC